MASIQNQIREIMGGWPGVTTAPHRFGGIEFRLGRKELGHLHGDRLADLPFPVRIREELVAAGLAETHHVLPQSGWVSRRIDGPADLPAVIALFRRQYERMTAAAPALTTNPERLATEEGVKQW